MGTSLACVGGCPGDLEEGVKTVAVVDRRQEETSGAIWVFSVGYWLFFSGFPGEHAFSGWSRDAKSEMD